MHGADMLIEERQIPVDDLRPGMFVSRLDRDWAGTPFLLQGFLVETQADIDRLAQYCAHVVVDVQKSDSFVHAALQTLERRGPRVEPVFEPAEPTLQAARAPRPRPVLVGLEDELPRAGQALEQARTSLVALMDELCGDGRLEVEAVAASVAPVVGTILRNPDAYFWLELLQQHDSYTYSHALNCCAFMAAFGRHLGYPDPTLRVMATGGLLMDIGKTALPDSLLDTPGPLDAEQTRQVRTHVERGLALYAQAGGSDPEVRDILAGHHEREDGTGYPQGLSGDAIGLFARIAGIVDAFDAMTSKRPWRPAMSRYDALQELYRQRGRQFHADLVEQFVQCLGVYPVGTLVELSSGEVAIVMAQNPARRLFPRVMLLTDGAKRRRASFQPLDLRETWVGAAPARLSIRRALAAGSYGLDPRMLYL